MCFSVWHTQTHRQVPSWYIYTKALWNLIKFHPSIDVCLKGKRTAVIRLGLIPDIIIQTQYCQTTTWSLWNLWHNTHTQRKGSGMRNRGQALGWQGLLAWEINQWKNKRKAELFSVFSSWVKHHHDFFFMTHTGSCVPQTSKAKSIQINNKPKAPDLWKWWDQCLCKGLRNALDAAWCIFALSLKPDQLSAEWSCFFNWYLLSCGL